MSVSTQEEKSADALAEAVQLVTFRVGHVWLAINIAHVQEINRLMDITPVPEAPDMIHGVVNLRGDLITVINPHRIFELPSPQSNLGSRNLILNVQGERIGVLVDSVSDIVSIHASELSPRPQNMREIDRRFIDSVYLRENDLIAVLDPQGLVAAIAE